MLYTQAQEGIEPRFDGKPVNLPPFLNNLLAEVNKYNLGDAVRIKDTSKTPVVEKNIITDYGSITDQERTDFFTTTRAHHIRGFDSSGNP